MEHTKKLLYQYEAMMQLKNEEKLSKHQAWESELEVRSPGRVGRSKGQRGVLTMPSPTSQFRCWKS